MTSTQQNVTPQPAPGEGATNAPQIPSGIAAQVAAALAGEKAGSGSASGKVETPAEIEVPWNGTQRKMRVDDLVAAAQKSEELSQLQVTLDRKLKTIANADQLQALHEAISELSPDQRLRMQRYIQQQGAADDQPDDGDEPAIDAAIRQAQGKKPGQGHDPIQKDLTLLKDSVKGILQVLAQKQQQEQTQTVSQQIDTAMKDFAILKVGKGETYWRRQILRDHQDNPQVPLSSLVAQVAQAAQSYYDAGAKGVFAEVTSGSADGSIPPQKFKGVDLTSGGIAEAAIAAMRAASRA